MPGEQAGLDELALLLFLLGMSHCMCVCVWCMCAATDLSIPFLIPFLVVLFSFPFLSFPFLSFPFLSFPFLSFPLLQDLPADDPHAALNIDLDSSEAFQLPQPSHYDAATARTEVDDASAAVSFWSARVCVCVKVCESVCESV